MKEVVTNSPEETAALGEAWAQEVAPGWTLALCGDLGAGKTQLVRGLARGLGFTGRVASPTFALVNEYTGGRLPLFHLDLYRLDTRAQIAGAGLDEYFFTPRGVTVVEWAERWWGEAPAEPGSAPVFQTAFEATGASPARQEPRPTVGGLLRWVKFTSESETRRRIEYEDFGT